MTTMTPLKPLSSSTIWTLIVAVLLVIVAAMVIYLN
jgi:hypothetical protein